MISGFDRQSDIGKFKMSEEDPGHSRSHKGERIRSYDLGFKLKVVDYATTNGNRAAAKYFRIDRKRVREWRQNESKLRGGRKIIFKEIDQEIFSWMKERRQAGVRVTGKALKTQARKLHLSKGNQSFKGSCGWLRCFMKRHNISFRRQTHVAQKNEEVLGDRMHGFLKFILRLRKRQSYPLSMIGNMDETPVWVDMPGDYTLEERGVRTVTMGSTGHEKSRITVCLAAMGDGTKLHPLVLLKGVRPPKNIPLGVYVLMTPAAWSNESVIEHWLKVIWRRNSSNRRLLIWDAFSAHKTDKRKLV